MPFPLLALAFGLTEFVPTLAKWLGGNDAANVATKVVEAAKKITKTDNHQDTMKVLKENQPLVLEFQREVIKLLNELELEMLADRNKARERDIALAKLGRKNMRADIMVLAAAAGLGMCLWALSWYSKTLPGEAVGIISTIAGIFGACLKDAYAFEFGSSRGSKEKDITVAGLVRQIQ